MPDTPPQGIPRVFRITSEDGAWDILTLGIVPVFGGIYYMRKTQVHDLDHYAIIHAINDGCWEEFTLEQTNYSLDEFDLTRTSDYYRPGNRQSATAALGPVVAGLQHHYLAQQEISQPPDDACVRHAITSLRSEPDAKGPPVPDDGRHHEPNEEGTTGHHPGEHATGMNGIV